MAALPGQRQAQAELMIWNRLQNALRLSGGDVYLEPELKRLMSQFREYVGLYGVAKL